jgi:hypothetical protein
MGEGMSQSQSVAFRKWYETKGRQLLSEKRKRQYREDPAYREQVKQRSEAYRKQRRQERPSKYSVSYAAAADYLGTTTTHLTRWWQRGWFPEPYELRGRYYFTKPQVSLLVGLTMFLVNKQRKLTAKEDHQRQLITEFIGANW